MRRKITIDSEYYGNRSTFTSLRAAQRAIRACGTDFVTTALRQRGQEVLDEEDRVVGSIEEARNPHAVALGRIRTPRKATSSRQNAPLGGLAGGRPIISPARLKAITTCREAIGQCACGARGTWAAYIVGSARNEPTVWPGCRTHQGQTAGAPVPHLTFTRAIGRIQQLTRMASLLDKE